jgi:DNA polymerase
MAGEAEQQLRAYVEYLRDIGVHDFYRRGEPVYAETNPTPPAPVEAAVVVEELEAAPVPGRPAFLEPPIATLVSFDDLAPLPESRVAAAHKAEALAAIQEDIGDCTRCPLAYAGRRTIVFGDGDANARLMFVGEGPGADEDTSGVPFVGKAGQLLNNMIQAMGLKREQVYIANIVKCRPPANRVPEPVEANTCDQFLLQQIIGPARCGGAGCAAMYLPGVNSHRLRYAADTLSRSEAGVTYHPCVSPRPATKERGLKDLQMVMTEMGWLRRRKRSAQTGDTLG